MSHEERTGELLRKPIYDGLGAGRLGVVASRAGVGKSTCLVRIALGELVHGRAVLHVSLDTPVDRVRAAYDAKLDALHARAPEAHPASMRLEVERRRVIHSYLGGSFAPEKLGEGLAFLAESMAFRPSTIVLDGYRFDGAAPAEIESLARVAADAEARLWASALVRTDEARGEGAALPEPLGPFASCLDVVLCLEPEGDEVRVLLLKEGPSLERRELPIRLDPATMLLVPDD